jgi:hypothetical protein
MESMGIVYAIGVIFLVILAILWFFLPFAIFGTKPLLEKLLAETQLTNQILDDIRASPDSSPEASPDNTEVTATAVNTARDAIGMPYK